MRVDYMKKREEKRHYKRVNVPRYMSIVSKQMLAFTLMLLPIICFFWLLYDIFRKRHLTI